MELNKFDCGHDLALDNLTYDGRCRQCKRARDRKRAELTSERERKRIYARAYYYIKQGRPVPDHVSAAAVVAEDGRVGAAPARPG
jgi:hypothetical protein